MMYRVFQSIGLAFLFVPINTLCYVGVPQEQNNQISSMINLTRNLGRQLRNFLCRHHALPAYPGASVQSRCPYCQLQPDAKPAAHHEFRFRDPSGSGPQALQQAYGSIYGTMQQQASVLGYKDTIVVMAILTVAVMPFVARRKPKPGEAHMGH